jgi:hypothetical protein
VVPVYTGANSGTGARKLTVEKSPNTAFTGDIGKLNVSEVRDGVTLQPPSLAAKSGLHVLIAISRKDLKPAPSKLPLQGAPQTGRPERGNHRGDHTAPVKPTATASPGPAPAKHVSKLVLALPLLVPVAFFLVFAKRLKFMSGHGYATSAVPEGVGPAEAGYLMEGSLKVRHVLGALSAVVAGHYSHPDSATIDPAAIGPVERRAIEILKRRTTIEDNKEIKTFLSGYLHELQTILLQNLRSLNMLEEVSPTSRYSPSLLAGVLLALTSTESMRQDLTPGAVISIIALAATGYLAYSLSSLTQRGVRAKLKVIGLHRFLLAHAQELKSDAQEDYLKTLRPYAVAFGLAKEDAF